MTFTNVSAKIAGMKEKTTREKIYDYIKGNQKAITAAPSVREMELALDISLPVIDYHVKQLIKQGRLVKHKEGRRVRYEFND